MQNGLSIESQTHKDNIQFSPRLTPASPLSPTYRRRLWAQRIPPTLEAYTLSPYTSLQTTPSNPQRSNSKLKCITPTSTVRAASALTFSKSNGHLLSPSPRSSSPSAHCSPILTLMILWSLKLRIFIKQTDPGMRKLPGSGLGNMPCRRKGEDKGEKGMCVYVYVWNV